MRRILTALLAITAVVGIALFFAGNPGAVSIAWRGWQIDTSVGVALLLLVLAVVGLLVAWRLLTAVLGAPRRYLRRRRENHRLRGFRDLTRGLVAIAAGDGHAAERHRRRAELAFQKGKHEQPPLALLLSAQGALMRGDKDQATEAFGAMLRDPETAFLGYRGLIMQAAKSGDDRTALQLTEKARRLQPGSSWVLQHQLALEARLGDWRNAAETLRDAVRRRAVTAETGRRYKMVLHLAHSQQAQSEQLPRDSLNYAAQAHGLDDGFAPAAVHYAGLLRDGGRTAKGLRVLETAWSRRSHPEIAKAYDLLLASEAPVARARRFERLVDLRPNDPEAHIAAAAMAMTAQLWGEAHRHLDRAGAQGPGPWSHRLCELMAGLERAERRNAEAERLWLERMARAPREPGWVCQECQGECNAWRAVCPSCQSFATLQWDIPRIAPPAERAGPETVILPPDPQVGAGAGRVSVGTPNT